MEESRGKTHASVFLMATGIRTSDGGIRTSDGGTRTSVPAVIWAFAAVWPLTLILAFRLLCRWPKPRDSR
ncbi:hypothetical protein [Streptomyces sp. 2A115]|uniref:hypothetical protein n=1 Tax=Streptomyces sp. 2A115 TaxID=3457439 RepID=UPI003FD5BA86